VTFLQKHFPTLNEAAKKLGFFFAEKNNRKLLCSPEAMFANFSLDVLPLLLVYSKKNTTGKRERVNNKSGPTSQDTPGFTPTSDI
jgi:hypothetical protein